MSIIDWKRKRHPDDVPTPIAVALADFCRRAKAPGSPGLVREALAVLSHDDDFRVKALADGEPPEKPLGPFAVIDIILGTEPTLASQREACGYYALAFWLVQERSKQGRTPPSAPRPPSPSAPTILAAPPVPIPPSELKEGTGKTRKPKSDKRPVSERIQPQLRTLEDAMAHDTDPEPMEPALQGANFLTKRDLPAPRGRFSKVDPQKTGVDALLKTDAREEVAELVASVSTRHEMRQMLDASYTGRGGSPVSTTEVESILTRHSLLDEVEKKEREIVLAHLTEHRGSISRTANALGIATSDFTRLSEQLKIKREVVEIRDRFIREALNPRHLSQRLDLIGRTRYLDDLRIEKKFREALVKDLKEMLDEMKPTVSGFDALIEAVAKKHGVHAELLARAVEKLGLSKTYAR